LQYCGLFDPDLFSCRNVLLWIESAYSWKFEEGNFEGEKGLAIEKGFEACRVMIAKINRDIK
jgi:hypothetical protein